MPGRATGSAGLRAFNWHGSVAILEAGRQPQGAMDRPPALPRLWIPRTAQTVLPKRHGCTPGR